MPLNTDFNISPYFDDYDVNKNYHRVLFRPSVAVQARELTQLQTILQNQVERFGNWAFKNGDIVSGCAVYDLPSVPYIRLTDFASNGSANTSPLDVTDYINAVATSATSGLKAKVVFANAGFTTNYPETNILYVNYINTGTSGETQFSNSELLTFELVDIAGNTALTNVYTFSNAAGQVSSGNAHGITVSEGVVFINGNFVRVSNSTFGLVNTYGTYAGNSVVGFTLLEEIITENQDSSLLDNALGYSNENAPGAHRLKLTPQIVSLDPVVAANTKGFNPIGTYNYGAFVNKSVAGSNLYSIVGDVVAKRTYEESGNYVVNPFVVDTITSAGIGSEIQASNSQFVLGRISPGVGYAQGKRVELLKTSYINMRRGIDTAVSKSQLISFNYENYFILNEVAGSFEFDKTQTVQLYNEPQQAVTNRTFSATTPVGSNIGTALMRCFKLASGKPGSNTAQYFLHVFNISLTQGYNTNQVKSVYYDGTVKGVGDVISDGVIGTDKKTQLYSFGVTGLKNLRDEDNNVNTEYVYRTKSSGNMSLTGNVTVTLTTSATGGTDYLPYGVGILTDITASDFLLIATANVDSSSLTGTVNVNTTSTNVTGTATLFNTYFTSGDQIKVDNTIRTVTAVTNNTFLTVDSPFALSNAAGNYYKSYIKGKVLPIAKNVAGPNGFIEVTNSTSFTISSGQIPSSGLTVDIIYDVNRTVTVPAKKTIRKNRFVKINTASNPNGPWCLGFSDIHKVSKIYATTNGSYTTSGIDVSDYFTYETGQKDTHYDYGYLYSKGSYDTTNTQLLVQLDYFTANISSGVGFFTVESYPVDDANTANTNAIQTKDIPLYVNETGSKLNLRDYIDFRTPSNSTSTDTGDVDLSNSAQITAAISSASLNPSSNLVLYIPTNGLNFPSYSKNFQADYTRYLGRKDLVMITSDNLLKVKEGVSSDAPQTPLFPDNAMPLATINIPPYPSLSSDQVGEFLTLNQKSRSLIRDTSTAISGSMVTNRRYTMKDIGTLDQRITNLEYYTQLSLLEKKAKDLTVTDANGLDRFKNGIFVDPFTDRSLGDVSNPEYSIAIDTSKGVARPQIIREFVDIQFNDSAPSSNVVQTGRLVTLDYDEVFFMAQPYATKFRNSALVAFAWNGKVILIPNYDNHQDLNNTGSINITIDNSTPWKDFAKSPFATTFGDWRTTTETTSNTVIDGVPKNINFTAKGGQFGGGGKSQAFINNVIAAVKQQAAAAGIDPNLVVGNLTINYLNWSTKKVEQVIKA